MTTDKTPIWGISEWTRKPVERAARELAQAINALSAHHAEEREALPVAAGDLARAGNDAPGPERDYLAEHTGRLESIAVDLRLDRDRLLNLLRPLQDRLAAVAEEGHSLLPENAMRTFDPTPHGGSEAAPRPISGTEPNLNLAQWLHVLTQNVQWTRRRSATLAVQALGPAYLLSTTIEHPTAEAMQLRSDLEAARDELICFIGRDVPR